MPIQEKAIENKVVDDKKLIGKLSHCQLALGHWIPFPLLRIPPFRL